MLGVNGALTSINMSGNDLTNYGTDMMGIKELAAAMCINGALTKLSLAKVDKLGRECTKFLCDALVCNNTLKELDLSGGTSLGGFRSNIGGTAGAKHVAKMLLVNGALTVTNLLGNELDEASAKMLAEVAKQKGISLCGIQRDQTTADFSKKDPLTLGLNPPDAILLASDLSQAAVTGALTKME
jgi:hypothetical protein